MDGGVRLVGGDVFLLALVDGLGADDGLAQGVAAALVVADHAAGHPDLLGVDDAVARGDDARAGRDVNAGRHVAHAVEDQRVEHVDALGDDNGVAVALHLHPAAGGAALEIIDGQLDLLAVGQAVDAVDEQVAVHAQGGFPVRQLRRTVGERQEEIIHAQQAHLYAEVFQVRLQAHGGGGLAAAARAGQADERLFALVHQDARRGGADLVVKDLLAAQDKARVVAHGLGDVFNVDDSHGENAPYSLFSILTATSSAIFIMLVKVVCRSSTESSLPVTRLSEMEQMASARLPV